MKFNFEKDWWLIILLIIAFTIFLPTLIDQPLTIGTSFLASTILVVGGMWSMSKILSLRG